MDYYGSGDYNMDIDAVAKCNIENLADCNNDPLIWAAETSTPMLPEPERMSGDYMLTSEDQRFLLVFIMGTYFGPDVKAENPKKSALQRIAEGLPAYTSDQLTGSEMKMANAEQVFYDVLGKADEAVLLKQSVLRQFFQGNLKNQDMDVPLGDHRQFPDLFPTHLHPQSYHGGQYKIIENVVFINNPETSYMKQEDIERFKRLTGREDLMLDRNEATWGGDEISSNTDNMKLEDLKGEPVLTKSASFPTEMKEKSDIYQELEDIAGPAMLLLSSCPTMQQGDNIVAFTKKGILFNGSTAKRPVGPLIGLLDIADCEDAYLFHVYIPGVTKSDFTCKVETDGRVLIEGVKATGPKYVNRFSQIFEMKTRTFSSPGPFAVSFNLPGPVDPNRFIGNFGEDGNLEGFVPKQKS